MDITVSRTVASPKLTGQLVQAVAREIKQHVTCPAGFQASLVVVSPTQMRSMNKQYRGVDEVTDVLSFPYSEINGEVAGEIVLCYAQAKQQAAAKQAPLAQELAWLTTHGILHLLGYDHETPADAKIMRPLERIILCSILNNS